MPTFSFGFDPSSLTAGTPGSDVFQFGTSRNAIIIPPNTASNPTPSPIIILSDVLFTREGKDTLIAVDPEQDLPGLSEVDLLLGDANPPGFDIIPVQFTSSDRFVIGDLYQPYYNDGVAGTIGDTDFAILGDFNPTEDIVILHGEADDYKLEQGAIQLGPNQIPSTELYYNTATSESDAPDWELIAVFQGILPTNLDLNASYFEYQNTPVEGVTAKADQLIKQIATTGIDIAFGMVSDAQNNVYATGSTTGALGGSDAGDSDAFLQKFDQGGNLLWSNQIGTSESDYSYGVDVDEQQNVYIAGRTRGDLATTNEGFVDTFVVKYDANGQELWRKQFGSESRDNAFTRPQVHSGDNSVFVAGYTAGSLFDDNAGILADAWIAKYDENGDQVWGVQFGSETGDELFSIEVDSQDNVYTAGWTIGELEQGQQQGLYDAWIAKNNSTTGEQEWIKQFGSSDYDWAWDIVADNQGYIYATGWTLGELAEGEQQGSYDAWLAKFDSDGNQIWIKQFGTLGDDQSVTIDIGVEGNIYVGGFTDDLIGPRYDLETGKILDKEQVNPDDIGSYDAWIAEFDSEGNQQWVTQFGTSELDQLYDISFSEQGKRIFVSGVTEGSLGEDHLNGYDSWLAEFDTKGRLTGGFGQSDVIIA